MKSLKAPLISYLIVMLAGWLIHLSFNAYVQLTCLFVMVNVLSALSYNLISGQTGQFSLGHAGFMAVGAYFSSVATTKWALFSADYAYLNFTYSLLGAGLLAALFGFIVGQPSLRLKGDYLAIVTLGFGEIIRIVLLNTDYVGGARGFAGIPPFPNYMMAFGTALFWVIFAYFLIRRMLLSTHGRVGLSVREDEIAAEAMGVSTTQVKVNAFMLSSFFAGVAGGLFAHVTNYISPNSFGFLQSVNVVIIVVFGGLGSMTGAIVSAGIITVLPELLRPLQEITGVDLRMIIFSLLLITLMLVRPKGLFGKTEIQDLWRTYVTKK